MIDITEGLLLHSYEIRGLRNAAIEEAAQCVEGTACRDFHDEFCSSYGVLNGECDCSMALVAETIRELKLK